MQGTNLSCRANRSQSGHGILQFLDLRLLGLHLGLEFLVINREILNGQFVGKRARHADETTPFALHLTLGFAN